MDLKLARIYHFKLINLTENSEAYSKHRESITEDYLKLVTEAKDRRRKGRGSDEQNELSSNNVPYQLFTQSPYLREEIDITDEWKYPDNEGDKLKYFIFKDVWLRGFYINSGLKFGCDYIVYEADPLTEHARFLLVCKKEDEEFSALKLLIHGRLSNQVSKQLVLASLESITNETKSEDINYVLLKWRGNQHSRKKIIQRESFKRK